MYYIAEFEASMKHFENKRKKVEKQLRRNAFIIDSIFDELMYVQELVILPFFSMLLLPMMTEVFLNLRRSA